MKKKRNEPKPNGRLTLQITFQRVLAHIRINFLANTAAVIISLRFVSARSVSVSRHTSRSSVTEVCVRFACISICICRPTHVVLCVWRSGGAKTVFNFNAIKQIFSPFALTISTEFHHFLPNRYTLSSCSALHACYGLTPTP